MRRSTNIKGPMFLITVYYGLLGGAFAMLYAVPEFVPYLPFGGIETLLAEGGSDFEMVTTQIRGSLFKSFEGSKLAIGILGTILLMVPVSWVYFLTTRAKQVDRSFAQTIVVLPIIVAGIAMIVHNSLPLAFSLAGIVAAVRFRFSLSEPAHALYIFIAIAIGLAAGISALGIGMITSIAFVYTNLVLWKLDYGDDLTTPFFSFLTGRGRDDREL